MGGAYEVLEDYSPQAPKDTFGIIKGSNLRCTINFARIEDYTGDNPDYQGQQSFRYELQVVDHPDYSGRRFWKRFALSNPDKLRELADLMFALEAPFKSEDELVDSAAKITGTIVKVRAWGWTPPDADEPLQMHIIKGKASAEPEGTEPEGTGEKVPF